VYWEFEAEGEKVEWYLVDGTNYIVSGDQCFVGTANLQIDEDDVNPQNIEEEAEDNPDLEPAGTDEIDGEKVLVYEFDGESGDVTLYVLADSGYLRRAESDRATWNFHSWGEADPVEKPDMDCQDPSDY
jgi:hypothetical protein